MAPEMIEEFAREFHAELNRQARDGERQATELKRELTAIEKKIATMIDAIEAGGFNRSIKDRLDLLEARKRELVDTLAATTPTTTVRIHPNLAVLYRRRVEDLERLFEDDTTRDEAFQIVRSLIDRVVLTPTDDGLAAELHGDLAGILALCDTQNRKRPTAEAVRRQLSVVAGAGFEPATFRL